MTDNVLLDRFPKFYVVSDFAPDFEKTDKGFNVPRNMDALISLHEILNFRDGVEKYHVRQHNGQNKRNGQ